MVKNIKRREIDPVAKDTEVQDAPPAAEKQVDDAPKVEQAEKPRKISTWRTLIRIKPAWAFCQNCEFTVIRSLTETRSRTVQKERTVAVKDDDGNPVLNEDGTPQTEKVMVDVNEKYKHTYKIGDKYEKSKLLIHRRYDEGWVGPVDCAWTDYWSKQNLDREKRSRGKALARQTEKNRAAERKEHAFTRPEETSDDKEE